MKITGKVHVENKTHNQFRDEVRNIKFCARISKDAFSTLLA